MLTTIKTLRKNLTGWKTNNEAVRAVETLVKSAIIMVSSVISLGSVGLVLDKFFSLDLIFFRIGLFLGIILGFFVILKIIDKYYSHL